jgi:hypothetical protein
VYSWQLRGGKALDLLETTDMEMEELLIVEGASF